MWADKSKVLGLADAGGPGARAVCHGRGGQEGEGSNLKALVT